MEDMQVQIAKLEAVVATGFTNMHRRLDDQVEGSRERHRETVVRLERIEAETRATNGRVSRLEALSHPRTEATPASKPDAETVTDSKLKFYVGIALASVAGTAYVLMSVLGYHR